MHVIYYLHILAISFIFTETLDWLYRDTLIKVRLNYGYLLQSWVGQATL